MLILMSLTNIRIKQRVIYWKVIHKRKVYQILMDPKVIYKVHNFHLKNFNYIPT